MNRRLKSLVWPLAVLAVGVLAGWAADFAVGRYQAYGVYGLARPVADLMMIIGGVWLFITVLRLASRPARGT